MDIQFSCGNCGQHLEVDGISAGSSVDCPNCGKPVYVPSKRLPVGEASTPTRVTVKEVPVGLIAPPPPPRREAPINPLSSSIPPAIEGGLHCLVIGCVILILGMILLRMGYLAGAICSMLAVPFQIGALLCAIYGICHGSIKHGLALLAGVSVMLLLFMFGSLWGFLGSAPLNQPGAADMQKQMEQMLKQLHQ